MSVYPIKLLSSRASWDERLVMEHTLFQKRATEEHKRKQTMFIFTECELAVLRHCGANT